MYKGKRTLDEVLVLTCGACDEVFDTMQGLMAHQSMSRKCSWYKKGKLKAVFEPEPEQLVKTSSLLADAQQLQQGASYR